MAGVKELKEHDHCRTSALCLYSLMFNKKLPLAESSSMTETFIMSPI